MANEVRPFLRWVGGKTSSLPSLLPLFPTKIGRYIEPFTGGGSVLLSVLSSYKSLERVVANDINPELIELYRAVSDPADLAALKVAVAKMKNTFADFNEIREWNPWRPDPDSDFGKLKLSVRVGAWIYYLNRTCFNGLWRVNKSGKFNVPYGHRSLASVVDHDTLDVWARILTGKVEFGLMGYEDSLRIADGMTEGDRAVFVYMDPPYLPETASGFAAYATSGFGLTDYRKIIDWMAASRCDALLSSANTPDVVQLAEKAGLRVHEIRSTRSVAASSAHRGKVTELAISNY